MIVVTGGAGFIGSSIVWALNQRGKENILIVDHLGKDNNKWKNLAPLRYLEYMEKGSFLDCIDRDALPDNISCIIHMGACSSTTETDNSYLVENNFKYSQAIASYCLEKHIRLIYASSAATYGAGEEGYHDGYDEIERLRPLNMYGYSKQMFDLWAKRNDVFDDMVGLKFSNVFGPNECHKGSMRSVVNSAYHQIKETGKVKLFKSHREEYQDGEQMRDFIYIKDVINIVLHFLDHPEINGLFNAGSGKARTWNDLVKSVFRALGQAPSIEYIDMPESLRPNYQYFTELDMDSILKTGFKQKFKSLERNVEDYVQNYLAKNRLLGDENLG
ncbi:MAG: ADP-glyceromanno-heptose 6-epimerase [Lentisphaeraceae bacterium]|nr:ADP-glyceromanno-heptose 6-epimerase [Lentisphaeraceae bacterium]